MKKHSKVIALFLAVALVGVGFTMAVSAMATNDEATFDEADPNAEIIGDASILPEEPAEPVVPEQPEIPVFTEAGIVADEAFEVTADAYVFKEEKLLLVTVNNVSDISYSINVTVSYLNADGLVIGKETQAFDQLAPEYGNNFVFRPGYDFADFRLETEKTVYNGDCWKTEVVYSFAKFRFGVGDHCPEYPNNLPVYDFSKGGYVDKDGNVVESYTAYQAHPTYYVWNQSGKDVVATAVTLVIFDDNGEIYDVLQRGGQVYFDKDINEPNYKSFPTKYAFKYGDPVAEAEMNTLTDINGFVACTFVLAEDCD